MIKGNKRQGASMNLLYLTIIVIVVIFSIKFYMKSREKLKEFAADFNLNNIVPDFTFSSAEACDDPVWCTVPMPKTSHFKFFSPPTDAARWRKAQIQASLGEQVLLKQINTVFTNHMDYLDGDTLFRTTHQLIDYFIDGQHTFQFLSKNKSHLVQSNYQYELPPVYTVMHEAGRAPLVHPGYIAFGRDGTAPYFHGKHVKQVFFDRGRLLKEWTIYEKEIDTPFVLVHVFNENWGALSNIVPNRTIDWTPCCTKAEHAILQRMLDNPNLLLYVINQHSNFSHPKILTLPRGLPIYTDNRRQFVWDMMHAYAQEDLTHTTTMTTKGKTPLLAKKQQFVFAASSNWGHRREIKDCIASTFPVNVTKEELELVGYGDKLIGRIDEKMYYHKLITSRVSIALGGLGYDTFRLWESLTLGVLPVIERGFGLERTVWKLPVLLVDDFAEVTPLLLRSAYLQALYHVTEFEFQRLTQSFWWDVIMNVSRSRKTQIVQELFPIEAEDATFTRPASPFTCWNTNSCGKGTKRIPKKMC